MAADIPKDKESRIARIEEIHQSLAIQLYKYCHLAGFDPQTFDYEDYSKKDLVGIEFNENSLFLKSYCEKIIAIEKTLEKLNNEE